MKTLTLICVLIVITIGGAYQVYASQGGLAGEAMERNLDFIDFGALDEALSSHGVQSQPIAELVMQVISGELDFSPQGLLGMLASAFLRELSEFATIARNLLIIAVLSAVLKNLSDSFGAAPVGELGFLVVFALMVVLIFQAFSIGVNAATSMIFTLTSIMTASIPVLIGLLVFSGNLAAPLVFSPTIAFFAHFAVFIINYVLVPLITAGVVMTIVNCLHERDILKNLARLILTSCAWGLGALAFFFTTILSLQKIASPIAGNLLGRTARTAVEAVPIVGGVVGGAADMVGIWAQAARSGVLVALIILVGALCLATLVKLVVLVFMFKLTAALISPICDKRLVDCINSVGSFALLLLGCVATVISMFMLMAVILLSF